MKRAGAPDDPNPGGKLAKTTSNSLSSRRSGNKKNTAVLQPQISNVPNSPRPQRRVVTEQQKATTTMRKAEDTEKRQLLAEKAATQNKSKQEKMKKNEIILSKEFESMEHARDELGFVNVTGLPLTRKTELLEYAMLKKRNNPNESLPTDTFLKYFKMETLTKWFNYVLSSFASKRVHATNKARRSQLRPFTFQDHINCIAVGFVHAAITQCSTLRELIKSAKMVHKHLGMAGQIDRLSEWLRACQDYKPTELLKDLETAIYEEVQPGTISVIDESLPKSTHREVNPSTRCIIKMARKPSGLGRLIYQVVCEWEYSGLPLSFGFELYQGDDRMAPGEAFKRLVHKRFVHGGGIHAAFIGDAAFASNDVRTIVSQNALPTAGVAVDLTLSVNYSWDASLWEILSKDMGVDFYRTFYSPVTEATVVLFRVQKKKDEHLIIRWSNAYEDPRDVSIVVPPPPPRYSVAFARSLLKQTDVDLQTLASDLGKETTGSDTHRLVYDITGVDLLTMDTNAKIADATLMGQSVTLPKGGPSISIEELEKSDLKFLVALCKKHNLCTTPKSITKKQLIKNIAKSCKLNVQTRDQEINQFVGTTLSFKDDTKAKEDVLPDPVPDYKFSFNLQDILDHYFASIDTKIRHQQKEVRMFEIAFLMGLVNVWACAAEQKLRAKYENRRAYLLAYSRTKAAHPSKSYPIKKFLTLLRDDMLDGKLTS